MCEQGICDHYFVYLCVFIYLCFRRRVCAQCINLQVLWPFVLYFYYYISSAPTNTFRLMVLFSSVKYNSLR